MIILATTLPHLPNKNHVGAGYTRPYWLRHPDVRMPCVQTGPSDCVRTTNRPDEVAQNERMAWRTTASADVRVRHREWLAEAKRRIGACSIHKTKVHNARLVALQ